MKKLNEQILNAYFNSRVSSLDDFEVPRMIHKLHYNYLFRCCEDYGVGYRILMVNKFGVVSAYQVFDNFGKTLLILCTPFGYYAIDLEVY